MRPDDPNGEHDTSKLDTSQVRWQRVTDLIDQARGLEPAACAAFLPGACDGDRELQREVEYYLRFMHASHPVLDPRPSPSFRPGQTLGPYRVERLLGQGGMGEVLEVTDPELERRVALKLVRRDRLSGEYLDRFHREGRVLARLEHRAIARIFGVGTLEGGELDGIPYFTMELVDGEPIDTFCERRQLSVEKRLGLVLEIADALSLAHRNLVIHRDLKPGNVLVTTDGQPKLLDFGIAKDLDARVEALTATGETPLTVSWAGPEQIRGLAVSTATDVYLLGLLLYLLLCGQQAHPATGDQFATLRRICEEELPPPSHRAGDRRLARRLRGDLDAITAKALAKDPEQRYSSIDHFAEDLRRHLEARPVVARRGAWLYRAGRFVRRHRPRLALGMLAIFLLAAWLVEHQRVVVQARIAEEQSRAAEETAIALTVFARFFLEAEDPDERQQLLRSAEDRARRQLSGEPELLAHQLEALGLTWQEYVVDYDEALRLLPEVLERRRELYSGDHQLVARSLNNIGALQSKRGRLDLAESFYLEALEMKRRLGQSPGELTKIESNLANLSYKRGHLAVAEARYRKILETRLEAFGTDDPEVASSRRSLGLMLYLQDKFREAEPQLRQALALRRELDPESLQVAKAAYSFGRLRFAQGRLEEAEEILDEALGLYLRAGDEGTVRMALVHKELASLWYVLGASIHAEVFGSRAEVVLRSKRPEGWEVADMESQLGERWRAGGDTDLAAVCLAESAAILHRLLGSENIHTQKAEQRNQGPEIRSTSSSLINSSDG